MDQEKLIKQIGKILADLNIPYIITGGIAVVVWGRPRFTADIDIVVELEQKKIKQLTTRQLEDIESILKIQKKLDFKYIEKWVKIHRTAKFLKELIGKINNGTTRK